MKTLGFTLHAGEEGARMTKMAYTDARRELNHFLGLDVAQAIDTGDTVTDRQDAASLLDVDRGGGVQDAVLQDRRHLSGGRLVCKRAHSIRERREKMATVRSTSMPDSWRALRIGARTGAGEGRGRRGQLAHGRDSHARGHAGGHLRQKSDARRSACTGELALAANLVTRPRSHHAAQVGNAASDSVRYVLFPLRARPSQWPTAAEQAKLFRRCRHQSIVSAQRYKFTPHAMHAKAARLPAVFFGRWRSPAESSVSCDPLHFFPSALRPVDLTRRLTSCAFSIPKTAQKSAPRFVAL